jgi:hypothetical protein
LISPDFWLRNLLFPDEIETLTKPQETQEENQVGFHNFNGLLNWIIVLINQPINRSVQAYSLLQAKHNQSINQSIDIRSIDAFL